MYDDDTSIDNLDTGWEDDIMETDWGINPGSGCPMMDESFDSCGFTYGDGPSWDD